MGITNDDLEDYLKVAEERIKDLESFIFELKNSTKTIYQINKTLSKTKYLLDIEQRLKELSAAFPFSKDEEKSSKENIIKYKKRIKILTFGLNLKQ